MERDGLSVRPGQRDFGDGNQRIGAGGVVGIDLRV